MNAGASHSSEKLESLSRIWKQSHGVSLEPEKWVNDIKVVYQLGAGLGETMEFLYHKKPSFEEFVLWLNCFKGQEAESVSEDVLTEDDLAFWKTNGYVVLKQAVPMQQCLDAQHAIWEFLEASPNDRESWYKSHPNRQGLMVLFTQHAALEANRNSQRIKNAYRQLYGTDRIYKTVDKVSFNPPETDHFKFRGSGLHWDVSLALPIPFQLQGLLYLTDVTADGGAFHCVPGFHHLIEDWLFNVPPFLDARELAGKTLKPEPVAAEAGDFIIWHQALPHCATPNNGQLPRMVQYLTYLPEATKSHSIWI